MVGQFADQKPVLDRALTNHPRRAGRARDERDHLAEPSIRSANSARMTADSVNQTKRSLVRNSRTSARFCESLANAGPALTRSLSMLATYPWPNETLENWVRGDYGNVDGRHRPDAEPHGCSFLHRNTL